MWPFLRGLRYTCSRPLSPIKLTGASSTPLNYLFCDSRRVFSKVQEQLAPSDGQRRTIYALSTPPGKAGIAVVRVSGPDALLVWKRMVRTYKDHQIAPKSWKLERCHIILPDETNELLDDGLAVFFRAPKSFTAEDVVELHLHSGPAIISSVLAALSRLEFCRPAEPGEFTRRAFRNGRLDLTQVEGLKDLLDAETETQRRIALRAAGGAMRTQYDKLRTGIIGCLAHVEALIDFGEGEEFDADVHEQARSRARELLLDIQMHLNDHRRGEILRSGIRLTIFGPTNAGKSSLLNFLAQREAAIVTPVPGTTRDVMELSLDIGGLPVIVADTAGLRNTDDFVEKIGVQRAEHAVESANVCICVLSLPEAIEQTTDGLRVCVPPSISPLITSETLFLFNKSDLLPCKISADMSSPLPSTTTGWVASMSTGDGTVEFLAGLAQTLKDRFDMGADDRVPLITRARHRVHLETACRFLEAFLDTSAADVVLGAEELRYAAQAVGRVSGLIDVENVLDVVFKEFCIGK